MVRAWLSARPEGTSTYLASLGFAGAAMSVGGGLTLRRSG